MSREHSNTQREPYSRLTPDIKRDEWKPRHTPHIERDAVQGDDNGTQTQISRRA